MIARMPARNRRVQVLELEIERLAGKMVIEEVIRLGRRHEGRAMYYMTVYQSPIGEITLASNGEALCGLWISGQKYFGDTVPKPMENSPHARPFPQTKLWLDRYFEGKRPRPNELPLAPLGSGFRQAVWRQLLEIPYGEVMTYGQIAKEVAAALGERKPKPRAVGGAVAHNPISLIIPCHRAVGSNGSLTGFSSGVDCKARLLAFEGVDMSRLFVPRKGTAL